MYENFFALIQGSFWKLKAQNVRCQILKKTMVPSVYSHCLVNASATLQEIIDVNFYVHTVEPALVVTWIRQSLSHCGQLGGSPQTCCQYQQYMYISLPVYSGHLSNKQALWRGEGGDVGGPWFPPTLFCQLIIIHTNFAPWRDTITRPRSSPVTTFAQVMFFAHVYISSVKHVSSSPCPLFCLRQRPL